MSDFEEMIREYQNIEIPEELEFVVRSAIHRKEKQMRRNWVIRVTAAAVAILAVVFVGAVNFSPPVASAMADIPVLNNLVRLVTFTELKYEDERHAVDIKVPAVEGLEDSALEEALNQKYLDEGMALYQEFMEELGEEDLSPAVLALHSDYKVKTQTPDLLVVERIKLEVGASGVETVTYDNIDLKNQLIITLPSLFKDDSYVEVISANIRDQMRKLTDKEQGIIYWYEDQEYVEGFKRIDPEQAFYINEDGKLTIVFDECTVAPCVMGIVEFVVPTEAIQDILVSNAYIK
jgi:hypothetical protein